MRVSLNLILPDGSLMIYTDGKTDLNAKTAYDIVFDDKAIARIRVTRKERNYVIAKIESGTAPAGLEGKNITLRETGAASREPEKQQTPSSPPKEEIKTKINLVLDDGRLLIYQGEDSGLRKDTVYEVFSGQDKLGEIRTIEVKRTLTTAKIESGAAVAASQGKAVTLKAVSTETPAAHAEKPEIKEETPAEVTEEPQREKPPKPKPEERTPAPVVTTPAPKPQPVKKSRTLVYSMLRMDTHSSALYSNANFTANLSISKQKKNTIRSAYIMYGSDFSSRVPNPLSVGLSYTNFLSDSWYYSLGYLYQWKKLFEDPPRFESRSNLVSFNLYNVFGRSRDKSSQYTASLNYTTRGDFSRNQSMTGTLQYYQKFSKKTKVTLSYRWIYDIETKRHTNTQYGIESAFTINKRNKVSLGYFLMKRAYSIPGILDNQDKNLRLTLTTTLK